MGTIVCCEGVEGQYEGGNIFPNTRYSITNLRFPEPVVRPSVPLYE